ncbi:MAG: RES family NAD+ phosphorylase [Actinomycetota bacterium]|nr:RES family NAD+ phosphorylase [Actinomycetota bacterium]
MIVDASRLPRKTLRAGTRLYRIHRVRSGPWFFSSGTGRFDPTGIDDRGACYWAEDDLGAWIEAFRTRMLLPESEIEGRWLSMATLSETVVACDLTVRRALKVGVTSALTAGTDYSGSQAIADRLQGKRAAVRWRVRHDLRQRLIGVAWFGEVGPATTKALADLPATDTTEIPDDVIERACRIFGYEVLPNPPSLCDGERRCRGPLEQ